LNDKKKPLDEETREETPAESPEAEENTADSAAEWKEKCLRTAAEYQNYRSRTQKEREALGEDVRAETAARFLPVLDNLERALEAETADETTRKGVEMIHRQMLDIFAKLRVTEIEAQGLPFDHALMEAVMHIEDEALPENTVAQVFTKGYRMGDRILRHAMVQVAN